MTLATLFLTGSLIILIGIYWWLLFAIEDMNDDIEQYDEYLAEQCRLSYEMKKKFSIKPNQLTQINAVKREKK